MWLTLIWARVLKMAYPKDRMKETARGEKDVTIL